jgi:restriction system protein
MSESVTFRQRNIGASAQSSTPAEQLESAYLELRRSLASELDLVLKISPSDFEHLVVELLVGMGYGGVVTRMLRKSLGKRVVKV